MLAFVAAALFAVGFLLNASSTTVPTVISPISLLLLGLACLAAHAAGVGADWNWNAPRRRVRRRL